MQQAHVRDFAGFDIEFDNYGSTHSPENRALCEEIWGRLCARPAWSSRAGSHAALRPDGRHVSGRSLRQRHLPEVQVAQSVRRQLRQVRRTTTARPI